MMLTGRAFELIGLTSRTPCGEALSNIGGAPGFSVAGGETTENTVLLHSMNDEIRQ
jgi:hypothetical protein